LLDYSDPLLRIVWRDWQPDIRALSVSEVRDGHRIGESKRPLLRLGSRNWRAASQDSEDESKRSLGTGQMHG
jgi:hypothetical protein